MNTLISGFLGFVFLTGSVVTSISGELGRVEVDGRTVILHDDKTWEYDGEAPVVADNCTKVASEVLPISLCLDAGKWTFANLGGEAEIKLKLKSKELYLLVITEKTVIKLKDLKNAAISNAQQASGLTKVKTLNDGSTILDGHGFGRIDYTTTVDGIDITYANYYSSFEDKGSLQFVFFAAREEFENFSGEISEAVASFELANELKN